jgi:hypothetical protein
MPMPSITIPKSAYPAIQDLVRLSQDDFEAFVKALSDATPAISPGRFWHHVSQRVPQIEETKTKSIVNELFTMDSVRDDLGLPTEEFAKVVSDAAASGKSDKFPFSENDKATLETRLAKIFKLRASLSLTTKALDVLTSHDRVFYSARIITDLRPVFNKSGEVIEAAVIVHNLHIHYGQDDDHRDFYVALDTSDIQSVRDVLDRADKKARSLEELLRRSGVSYLDADE